MPAMIIAALLEHEAFEGDGEAGERVVERDHDRHVGAADRQRHRDAEQQREREEVDDVASVGWPWMHDHDDAERERRREDQRG